MERSKKHWKDPAARGHSGQRQQSAAVPSVLDTSPLVAAQRRRLRALFGDAAAIPDIPQPAPHPRSGDALLHQPTPIQRSVVDDGGSVVCDRNVAVSWKGGGAYADTPSLFNGKTIPPTSNKLGMILEPVLAGIPGRYRLKAAEQHVAWRIEEPRVGPWEHPDRVDLPELDAFASLQGYQAPRRTQAELAAPYTLRVRGAPSDNALRDAIFIHELHHVQEQDRIVDRVLKPWDLDVAANGVEEADPLTAFSKYDEQHIRSAQGIANELVEQLRREGEAFHRTDAGKEPDLVGVDVDRKHRVYTVTLRPHG